MSSTAAHTLQRLERVLLMVPWLLEHPGATVDEIAERFGATPREVLRDLDVLGYCGLPGYGGGDLVEVSVMGDRVVVRMAEFFRRPLALSLREALTLLLAASALAGVEDLPESAPLTSALDKLRGALGAGAQVAIDLRSPGDEHLEPLRRAVGERRLVHLIYRSASKAETTSRTVEPWAVMGARGGWYLWGWCHLAEAPRHFRLDRVKELRVGEQADGGHDGQRPPPSPEPAAYRPEPGDRTIVLDLHEGAWWLAEWIVADAVEARGPRRRLTFRTAELEWVARLLLRLGEQAEVVEPADLAARVRELAEAALRRYERTSGASPS